MSTANTLSQIPMVATVGGKKPKKTSAPKASSPTKAKGSKSMSKPKKSKALTKAAHAVNAAGGRVVNKRRGPVMIAGSKVGKVGELANAKKFSKAAIEKAIDEKHTMFAVGTAAAMGYLQGSGNMPEIPTFGGLSPEAILGAAAWAGAKYTKSKMLEHASTGLLSVAAFQMANEAAKSGDLDIDYDDY